MEERSRTEGTGRSRRQDTLKDLLPLPDLFLLAILSSVKASVPLPRDEDFST